MAEEHRCQAPEGHRLCVNNCGFLGSPATMNLCSKCYRDSQQQQQQQQQQQSQQSTSSFVKPSISISSSSASAVASSSSLTLPDVSTTSVAEGCDDVTPAAETATVLVTTAVVSQTNRCFVCRKRVGLTGLKCRCGTTFCGTHRYPERHGCAFDFKKLGREEIAKANPLVKAEKLEKI